MREDESMRDIFDKPQYKLNFCWPLKYVAWCWFRWNGGSIGYFGCSNATNTIRHLIVFGWHICEWRKLEYADPSDKERADEYLEKWSECEKELQMYRVASLGEHAAPEVKKLIKESLGVDLDEGTIQ